MRTWLKEGTAKIMSVEQASWLAGFFDGEGNIGCHKRGPERIGNAWRICIANTHKGSLDYCKEITGAGSIIPKKNYKPGHHKDQYVWNVYAQRDVVNICKQMLPYLIVKKDQVSAFVNNWRDVGE